MKQTPPRSRFKQHFGHANHYLVTSLVALHHLNASEVIEAPPELHTSWNPKDKRSSINRTRIFILQSSLGSAVDAIDMYISLLYRKPNYIQDDSLGSELDGTKRSVLKKVLAVANHYSVEPITLALVDILITWRNNVVHELAENNLQPETKEVIKNNADTISEKYRGLIPDQLPEKAEKGDTLTFKETTSLINAAHHFVEQVDTAVISRLDVSKLCHDVVRDELMNKEQKEGFANKYFSLPAEKRSRFIRNWLMNRYGITNFSDDALQSSLHIKPQTINKKELKGSAAHYV